MNAGRIIVPYASIQEAYEKDPGRIEEAVHQGAEEVSRGRSWSAPQKSSSTPLPPRSKPKCRSGGFGTSMQTTMLTRAFESPQWFSTSAWCDFAGRRFQKRSKRCKRMLGTQKLHKRGEEKPLKIRDHDPDAFRYFAKTQVPYWRLAWNDDRPVS